MEASHSSFFIAERQIKNMWIPNFRVLGLTQPEIESKSTVSVVNVLSTQPFLTGCILQWPVDHGTYCIFIVRKLYNPATLCFNKPDFFLLFICMSRKLLFMTTSKKGLFPDLSSNFSRIAGVSLKDTQNPAWVKKKCWFPKFKKS